MRFPTFTDETTRRNGAPKRHNRHGVKILTDLKIPPTPAEL